MQQYLDIKAQYPDVFCFPYRRLLELFYKDAVEVGTDFGIVLDQS